MDELVYTAFLCLQRAQPFVLVPMSRDSFSSVFERLCIDREPALRSHLSEYSHLAFRGRRAGMPCIVHLGLTKASQENVSRHLQGLSRAHTAIGSVLGDILPKILVADVTAEMCLLVEHEVFGETLKGPVSPCKLSDIMHAAMEPLTKIQQTSRRSSGEYYADLIMRELSLLEKAIPEYNSQIRSGLARLQEWIVSRDIVTVPTHGDYAPRNLFFLEDYSAVSGILDWEWYWNEGPIGFDAIKFMLEVQVIQEGKTIFQILADFLSEPEGAKFAALRAAAGGCLPTSVSDLWHIALLIWLRILWMGVAVTEPVSPEWLRNAVMLPAIAMESAYARIRQVY
jgi:hypothetical protein